IGCGGTDEPAKSAAPAKTDRSPSTAAPSPAAPAVKTGGRLARAQTGDPPTFDQTGSSTTLVNLPSSPGYSGLMTFDWADATEKPTSIKPELASSWEVAPDGMTYTFKLVPGVKFHDGKEFTAQDVVASLQRQISPPKGLVPPRREQLEVIQSMTTPDATTINIKMKRPTSPTSMLPILAQGWMVIYSKADIEGGFNFNDKINGTGPFMNMTHQKGNRVSWQKNPNYFRKGMPYLDGLDVYVVPDNSTRIANLQSGQLHMLGVTPADMASLQKALGDKATYYTDYPNLGFNSINFNSQAAPWKDARVRQAVNLALNKQSAIQVLGQGHAIHGGYFLPAGSWTLSSAEIQKLDGWTPQDANSIGEAKKLLSAAGVAEGHQVALLTRSDGGTTYTDTAVWVTDQLSKVGLKASTDLQITAVAYDRLNKRQFDLAPWVHGISLDDPDALWQEFYLPESPRNYSQLSSQAIVDAFSKQTTELDLNKRKELVNTLQKISLPALSKMILYWSLGQAVMWKTVRDYLPHHPSSYNIQRMDHVWLNA
ncbi:MAG: ABC transporter substrate-binding protein, partial [Chloroflexi bacterium]|nr:ABC transporter substrate-binding protein [Chloroflexota bacterium]